MAKININFNEKNYSIDESALSTTTAEFESHLSTTMSGEGATIFLNGNTYNIDSSKLATVKNEFISHLGTIAGSGFNVVVGGVNYTIDSNKIASAISDLETAWSSMSNNVAVLDEAVLDYVTLG